MSTDLKFICVGDLHARLVPPSGRKDDYLRTMLVKLKTIRGAIKTIDADCVLFSGDIFHDRPSEVPHRLTNILMDEFSSFGCPVFVAPGNHDLPYHSIDNLEDSPLGILEKAGVVTLVHSKRPCVVMDDFRYCVCGREYFRGDSVDKIQDNVGLNEKEPAFTLFIYHQYMTKHGGEYFGHNVISYSDFYAKFPSADVVLAGHFHDYAKPEIVGETLFLRPGSVLRGSLIDEEVNRIPVIYAVRLSTSHISEGIQLRKGVFCKWKELKLPVEDSDKVFKIEERREIVEQSMTVNTFVESLKSLEIEDGFSVDGALSDLDGKVKVVVKEILEEARSLMF